MSVSWQESLRLILRARRQRLDLSLEVVANKIGTTKQLLSYWERGSREPRLVDAVRWCKALRIRLGDLLNLICTQDADFELFEVLDDDVMEGEVAP